MLSFKRVESPLQPVSQDQRLVSQIQIMMMKLLDQHLRVKELELFGSLVLLLIKSGTPLNSKWKSRQSIQPTTSLLKK